MIHNLFDESFYKGTNLVLFFFFFFKLVLLIYLYAHPDLDDYVTHVLDFVVVAEVCEALIIHLEIYTSASGCFISQSIHHL